MTTYETLLDLALAHGYEIEVDPAQAGFYITPQASVYLTNEEFVRWVETGKANES